MKTKSYINKANGNETLSAGINIHIPTNTWIGLGCAIGIPIIASIIIYFATKALYGKI